MQTSGLQTINQAAKSLRIRKATPFGVRLPLAALMVFLAAPLWASEPVSSPGRDEALRSMEAIAGKVREAYRDKRALDPKLALADLIKSEELSGRYCDGSNFGVHVESVDPPSVLVVYRKRFDYQPDDFYLRVDPRSDKFEAINKAAPDGVGQSPWPPDRALHEDRLRNFWWRAHRWYYFAGLSVTALIAGAWLITRNKWFSMRPPK